jgi:hypothetical protein
MNKRVLKKMKHKGYINSIKSIMLFVIPNFANRPNTPIIFMIKTFVMNMIYNINNIMTIQIFIILFITQVNMVDPNMII